MAKEIRTTGKGSIVGMKARLSSMPLSVLLPSLSDVSEINGFRAEFETALDALRGRSESHGEDESKTGLVAEQQMLQQVLQWLDVEAGEN